MVRKTDLNLWRLVKNPNLSSSSGCFPGSVSLLYNLAFSPEFFPIAISDLPPLFSHFFIFVTGKLLILDWLGSWTNYISVATSEIREQQWVKNMLFKCCFALCSSIKEEASLSYTNRHTAGSWPLFMSGVGWESLVLCSTEQSLICSLYCSLCRCCKLWWECVELEFINR